MNFTAQSAKHLRDVFFGGNWTTTNVREVLLDVDWKKATTKTGSFNTIVGLTYHIGYFVSAILQVYREGKLDAHDKFSFDHPAIQTEEDWQQLKEKMFSEVEEVAAYIENMQDDKLSEFFMDPKYGNYFRNIHGLIEHTHYHLGQIVIIKKLIV